MLRLRIHVTEPPAGFAYALQSGKGAAAMRLPHQVTNGESLTFELEVKAVESKVKGIANYTGPFAQGTPKDRFFYLVVGRDGEGAPAWQGRIKVPLWIIPWSVAERVVADESLLLEASFDGRKASGAPVLATVTLHGGGWYEAPR